MVARLTGAGNTPISASLMAVELSGPRVAPYAAVACVISFLMTGHHSVYPSQIRSVVKSPSPELEAGKNIEHSHVHFNPQKKSLSGASLTAIGSFKKRKNGKRKE